MLVVILGMLVCIVLAIAVLGLVAVPAARDGEAVFVPRDAPETDASPAAPGPADLLAPVRAEQAREVARV